MKLRHEFSEHFQWSGKPLAETMECYISGLFQAQSANMERMEEAVAGSDYQRLQYLISEGQWDEWAVMDHVGREASRLIGDPSDACLLIDESGFAKKGAHSAGVDRQYSGRTGKVDNCQVGVFACLARGRSAIPIYGRLFLPKSWTGSRTRMDKVHVPAEFRDHLTKPQIARDLVQRARAQGVQFGWVAADSLYGSSGEFLWELLDSGETVVFDVRKNHWIYEADPQPYQPQRRSSKGRPSLYRSDARPIKVAQLLAGTQRQWQTVEVRATTKGLLRLQALRLSIWAFDKRTGTAKELTLVATRNMDGKDLKFTLTNASKTVALKRIVYMARQRYWIERAFQEGKSNAGMADYQARGWHSWHRHMTLVSMALLLMERVKADCVDTELGMVTCADIREVLANVLPDRRISQEEVLRQLQTRHYRRRRSIAHAYEKQRLRPPDEWQEPLTE